MSHQCPIGAVARSGSAGINAARRGRVTGVQDLASLDLAQQLGPAPEPVAKGDRELGGRDRHAVGRLRRQTLRCVHVTASRGSEQLLHLEAQLLEIGARCEGHDESSL